MMELQAKTASREERDRLQQRASDLYRRAFDLSSAGCKKGDPLHCSLLGDAYRDGKGVAKNLDQARLLYTIGCNGQMAVGCDGLRSLGPMSSSSNGATSAPESAATTKGDRGVCDLVRCRDETTLHLVDESREYVVKVPPTPYAGTDALSAYPGDDYFVTAQEVGGLLTNFRYVDPPTQPKDVLHVQFKQEKVGNRFQMVLTIQSFFPWQLVYHALGHHPARPQREYLKTTTCPIGPMMRSIETWPTPMSFLKLTDFRFVSGKPACQYY
jgi:hypothetical protein